MQGSSAVTPVFVQKGKDVLLNNNMTADVPENFFTLQWKFNANLVLVTYLPDKEPKVSPVYTGRIETDVKKYSVKVKNVQKADSGVYTITVTGTARTQILAEYDVRVQGPVSPVELSVDSVSSSSDSCNLTVTCRTQDSNISSTFTCDNQTCSQEGGERSEVTTSGASLHVYLLNDSIICNHSNQVSWTKVIKMTENVCLQHADPDKQGNNIIVLVVVAFITVFVIAILTVVLTLVNRHRKRRKYERENADNTIYATPQVEDITRGLNQRPTDDSSGLSPTSTYSLVGPHTGPEGTTERGRTLPESVYAEVQRARS
ncbi:SLAM family member 9-like isoform X1 [Micropterus salmoides]|uniref:SLAM family member 9-like isoform X1 n=1 Tax=Micropterus salmoides TaxID=27706 RepID=UPI0018EBDD1B|nr:SLAM family member 9-like isoform X1 [Micropterus salmoides]